MSHPSHTTLKSVLIIDDHPVLRGGLEAMLRAEGGFRVVASVGDCTAALAACVAHGMPDVVLLDVRIPECDGFDVLARLRGIHPRIRVLMLAGMPLKHEAERARENGACGYLSKSTDALVILNAIHNICIGGEVFISQSARAVKSEHNLSPREVEVLEFLARGLSRGDIAGALGISSETVKSHVKSILGKLHAADRAEAVSRGYALGVLFA